jgi:hypothetical protein
LEAPVSDSFALQLSVKIGDALFNVRGESREEFALNLKFAHDNAAQVRAFCEEFKPSAPAPQGFYTTPARGATYTPPAPAAPTVTTEAVRVVGIETKEGVSDNGKPWKVWNVKFSSGKSASTFDALVASVAKAVHAEDAYCVPTFKPSKNPKFTDLDSIQRAGAPA